jgi:hypothetical protein
MGKSKYIYIYIYDKTKNKLYNTYTEGCASLRFSKSTDEKKV